MRYAKMDHLPKTHISHRVLRGHGDILLKLSFYSQVLFCRKQENLFVSLWLCVSPAWRDWLRLCARPTPLNHALSLIIFLLPLFTPTTLPQFSALSFGEYELIL